MIVNPGPIEKLGYPEYGYGSLDNACHGVVLHDSTGPLAPTMAELFNLDRRASWYATIDVDGTVWEHYAPNAITWHCGSLQGNVQWIGIEHTRADAADPSPISGRQLDASVALVRDLSIRFGFPLIRHVGLWEHNEVAPPSDPTSCPSGRIPWAAYEGGGRMYSDGEIDTKIVKAIGYENAKLDALSDAILVPLAKGDPGTALARLRYIYALAGKPFPGP